MPCYSGKAITLTIWLVMMCLTVTHAQDFVQLVPNPTFADEDANGKADGWYNKEGSPKLVTDQDGSYVSLQVTEAGKGCVLEEYHGLKGAKQITIAAKVRWENIVPGNKGWKSGTVQIMFVDKNNKKTGPYQAIQTFKGTNKDWKIITKTLDAPDDAMGLRIHLALYYVQQGTLDAQWISITPGNTAYQPDGSTIDGHVAPVPKPVAKPANKSTATVATTAADQGVQLVKNPRLLDEDGNGKIDSWYNKDGSPKPVKQDGQTYAFLEVQKADGQCVLEQYTGLKGAKLITISTNVRWRNIIPGNKPWKSGTVQAMFVDKNNKKVGPYQAIQTFKGTSNDWSIISKTLDVPDGALGVRLHLALYFVKQGQLDVQWISVVSGVQALDADGKPVNDQSQSITVEPAKKLDTTSSQSTSSAAPVSSDMTLPAGDGPEYAGIKGVSLLGSDPLAQLKPFRNTDQFTATRFEVSGQPFKQAVRVTNTKQPDAMWDMQLRGKGTAPVRKGDKLLLTYWVRSVAIDTEFGETSFLTTFELDEDPWTKLIQIANRFLIGETWHKVQRVYTAKRDLPVGKSAFSFQFGFNPQTFEIGGLSLYNYGPDIASDALPSVKAKLYNGHEDDAPWRKVAAQRIEEIRKADMHISVVDSHGKPVSNAKVDVKMTRHAFRWGTAVYRWFFYGMNPRNKQYQERAAELFNFAVLENGMKWGTWESGAKNRTAINEAIRWAKNNNIQMRGHTLVWPSFSRSPERLKVLRYEPDKLRDEINKHIRDIVTANNGVHTEWDVLNEPKTNHDFMDILGVEEAANWFKLAKQLDPEAKMFINENSILSGVKVANFESWIKRLREAGAPIEGIGMQGHLGVGTASPLRMWEIYDRFYDQFNVPIAITELDVLNDDEELQAMYLRDVMIASFAHPAIESIVFWGFWDGRHWKKNCPLYNEDWSEKKGLKVYKDLVFNQWWTNEQVTTSSQGDAKLRGFLGEYDITVTTNGQSRQLRTSLTREGKQLTIKLD